jgi:hypothetical protein
MTIQKSKPKAKTFSGPLNDPIVGAHTLALALEAHGKDEAGQRAVYQKERERLNIELTQKMLLLFSHYGIEALAKDAYTHLAWCLALDFVPGMHIIKGHPRKRGRPAKWRQLYNGARFVETIDGIQQERGRGILDAIRIAKKRHPKEDWAEDKPESLATRYHEARRHFSIVDPVQWIYEK